LRPPPARPTSAPRSGFCSSVATCSTLPSDGPRGSPLRFVCFTPSGAQGTFTPKLSGHVRPQDAARPAPPVRRLAAASLTGAGAAYATGQVELPRFRGRFFPGNLGVGPVAACRLRRLRRSVSQPGMKPRRIVPTLDVAESRPSWLRADATRRGRAAPLERCEKKLSAMALS